MHEIEILKDLVIILGAAVIVVAVLRRARIPSIAGFMQSQSAYTIRRGSSLGAWTSYAVTW